MFTHETHMFHKMSTHFYSLMFSVLLWSQNAHCVNIHVNKYQ